MRTVQLRKNIKEGKCTHRKTMEDLLQQNNASGVWSGLNAISGHKHPKIELKSDREWVIDVKTLVKPMLLREKLEQTALQHHFTMLLLGYLSNRLQFENRDGVSDTVVCSTGTAPSATGSFTLGVLQRKTTGLSFLLQSD